MLVNELCSRMLDALTRILIELDVLMVVVYMYGHLILRSFFLRFQV